MATKLEIIGGIPLQGEITVEVNKNAVLPVLCATILTEKDCILHNVPKSPDVLKILQALGEMGAQYYWPEKPKKEKSSTLIINCKGLKNKPVSNCVADIQSAILFIGPLLARFGEANVPVAIGCKLGYRGPQDLIEYLSHFDVKTSVNLEDQRVFMSVNKNMFKTQELKQLSYDTLIKHITFSESAVTATENLLMFLSCVTSFDVKLDGIAQEPHVRFFTSILREMGMSISGEGGILITKGVMTNMKGFECDFIYEPDYIDFFGHAVMVALTQGSVLLKCYITPAILHMNNYLKKMGVISQIQENGVHILGDESHLNFSEGFPKATEEVYKINPRPWPGSPVDSVPSKVALCAQHLKNRKVIINNWMYEDGLSYIHDLNKMGAQIKVFDTGFGNQKVEVTSKPTEEMLLLDDHDVCIEGVSVIEGTRALISFALQRKAKTIIKNFQPLLRRSPDFLEKLQNIGARVKFID